MSLSVNGSGYITNGSASSKSGIIVAPTERYGLPNSVATTDYALALGKPGTASIRSVRVGMGTISPAAMCHIRGSANAEDYKNSAGSAIPGIMMVENSSGTELFSISATVAKSSAATTDMSPSGTQVATFTTAGTKFIDTTTAYVATGLKNYMEGSFSITWAGAVVATVTAYFTWIGNTVTIKIPARTSAASAANSVVTGAGAITIAAIQPKTTLSFPVAVIDNGAAAYGLITIQADGAIVLGVGAGGIAFTNSTNCGWAPIQVTYHVDAVL